MAWNGWVQATAQGAWRGRSNAWQPGIQSVFSLLLQKQVKMAAELVKIFSNTVGKNCWKNKKQIHHYFKVSENCPENIRNSHSRNEEIVIEENALNISSASICDLEPWPPNPAPGPPSRSWVLYSGQTWPRRWVGLPLTAVWGLWFHLWGRSGCLHLSSFPRVWPQKLYFRQEGPRDQGLLPARGLKLHHRQDGLRVLAASAPPQLSGGDSTWEEAREDRASISASPSAQLIAAKPPQKRGSLTLSSRAGPRGLSRGNGATAESLRQLCLTRRRPRNRAKELPASAMGTWESAEGGCTHHVTQTEYLKNLKCPPGSQSILGALAAPHPGVDMGEASEHPISHRQTH